MQVQILDTTAGRSARVTDKNQLYSFAVTEPETLAELRLGNTYNFNTGPVNLTDANESAVAYLENTGSERIVLAALIVGLGNSTGGDATEIEIKVFRNPTAGTILNTPTNADMSPGSDQTNKNFASSKTLSVNAYKGANGDTITTSDGQLALIYANDNSRVVVPQLAVQLEQGNSIGITITPAANNTSLDVYAAFDMYVAENLFN